MPKFSSLSAARLRGCDVRLQRIFEDVIVYFDCIILEGHRDEDGQNAAFESGNSQIKWPEGKHNKQPSLAVDAAPYPVDWQDRERITLFAGFVIGVAQTKYHVKLRWGGDWDQDTQVKDNTFDDLVHFEVVDE